MRPNWPSAVCGASTYRSITLDPETFRALTRRGDLDKVLAGIDAAQAAGLAVKINTVALKGVNEHEIVPMIEWAHGRGMDLTFIEVMPLGEIDGLRSDQYLPLTEVQGADRRALHAAIESITRPAVRRAMRASRRPAAGSASSRR